MRIPLGVQPDLQFDASASDPYVTQAIYMFTRRKTSFIRLKSLLNLK